MEKLFHSATLSANGEDLVLTTFENPNADYQGWLDELAGWFGGVGVSADATQRTLGHGVFRDRALRTGRSLTVTGQLTFSDPRQRSIGERFVSGLLGDGEYGTLTATVDDLTLSTEVRLDGEIKISRVGLHSIDVQIPLLAPDPFLHGEAKTYQVYPAGAGTGLVFPLLTGSQALTLAPTFDATGVETVVGPEGQTGISTNKTLVNSARWMIPVKRGVTYRQTVWARADKEGSHATIRTTRVNGTQSSPYLFWPKPVPTEWTKYVSTITADGESVTDFRLDVWTNHSGGEVRDARQDIVVLLEELPAVLSFGNADPNTRAELTNAGNATAYPVITVKGDLPGGFRIKAGGQTIEYPSPVWETAPVQIDCAEGAVYVDGMDQTYRATKRQWFEIPPGGQIAPTIHSLSPGDGWAEILVNDTYL